MISFWERQHLLHTDVAIIGGGITGLSVAASLIERMPHLRITVFERSAEPYGASTRNAGFACFGSLTELMADVRHMGEESARELLFHRWLGLQITRARLGEERIGFRAAGGYEWLAPDVSGGVQAAMDRIPHLNDLVEDFLPGYFQDVTEAARSWWQVEQADRVVSMRDEGQVDTGLLLQALESYVSERGVRIRTGSEVQHTESGRIVVADRVRGALEYRVEHMVHCTNAFAPSLWPEAALWPGRGQVLVTHPIQGLAFDGNLHFDEGYYYLRTVAEGAGKRILFGGGRNLDMEGETTRDFLITEAIQQRLEAHLKRLFPAHDLQIDMRWSGIMAFGADKVPLVRHLGDGQWAAVKMGGMGIALAGHIGEALCDLLCDQV